MPMAKPETLAKYYHTTGLDKTGAFRWEDQQYHPLPQDFADMIGWKEMAQKAGEVYNALPEKERDSTMIYCRVIILQVPLITIVMNLNCPKFIVITHPFYSGCPLHITLKIFCS